MPKIYQVTTTRGEITLFALSRDQATFTAIELMGPKAQILRVLQPGEW